MKIELNIDPTCAETRVLITAPAMTDEVQELMGRLAEESPQMLVGRRDGKLEILSPDELIRVYAEAGKVLAVTPKGEYALRLRLYEVEQRLDARRFVRISNGEIISLSRVDSFDLSLSGTICVRLVNGTITYVSRRYMAGVKKILGI